MSLTVNFVHKFISIFFNLLFQGTPFHGHFVHELMNFIRIFLFLLLQEGFLSNVGSLKGVNHIILLSQVSLLFSLTHTELEYKHKALSFYKILICTFLWFNKVTVVSL